MDGRRAEEGRSCIQKLVFLCDPKLYVFYIVSIFFIFDETRFYQLLVLRTLKTISACLYYFFLNKFFFSLHPSPQCFGHVWQFLSLFFYFLNLGFDSWSIKSCSIAIRKLPLIICYITIYKNWVTSNLEKWPLRTWPFLMSQFQYFVMSLYNSWAKNIKLVFDLQASYYSEVSKMAEKVTLLSYLNFLKPLYSSLCYAQVGAFMLSILLHLILIIFYNNN